MNRKLDCGHSIFVTDTTVKVFCIVCNAFANQKGPFIWKFNRVKLRTFVKKRR